MKKLVIVALVLAPLAACSKCAKDKEVTDKEAPVVTDAPATDEPASEGGAEFITFSKDGWTGGRGQCTENMAAEGCDSEWRHTETKQLVRVFVVPLKDVSALKTFQRKLDDDVKSRGGIAEHISMAGLSVTRFLERARQAVDGGAIDVASLNYAVTGKDLKAVHLITSIVPFDDQQPSDQRLRDLLTTASWAK